MTALPDGGSVWTSARGAWGLVPRAPGSPDSPFAAQPSFPFLPCAPGQEPRPHRVGGRGTPGWRERRYTDVCGEQEAKSTLAALLPTWQHEVSPLELPVLRARFLEHEVSGDVVGFVASHFCHARGPSSTSGGLVTHTQRVLLRQTPRDWEGQSRELQ